MAIGWRTYRSPWGRFGAESGSCSSTEAGGIGDHP
jgi:hypothetical protein